MERDWAGEFEEFVDSLAQTLSLKEYNRVGSVVGNLLNSFLSGRLNKEQLISRESRFISETGLREHTFFVPICLENGTAIYKHLLECLVVLGWFDNPESVARERGRRAQMLLDYFKEKGWDDVGVTFSIVVFVDSTALVMLNYGVVSSEFVDLSKPMAYLRSIKKDPLSFVRRMPDEKLREYYRWLRETLMGDATEGEKRVLKLD